MVGGIHHETVEGVGAKGAPWSEKARWSILS